MANNYYLGRDPEEVLGDSPQFFYAIRRNDDGELFLIRSDQLKDPTDEITINVEGAPAGNFEDFEPGIDYFEGIRADHEVEYANMFYPQYRWDNRAIFYYVNESGNLVQRINKGYAYPEGISSDGADDERRFGAGGY